MYACKNIKPWNRAKIKSEWRDILRKIKCKQLHEDLKAIKKECDESIQRKNAVIRRLLSDLDESEEIFSAMLHSHMNIIEKLIGNKSVAKKAIFSSFLSLSLNC